MCKSYLNRYGKKDKVQIVDVFYFTAIKEHLRLDDPETVLRHENYIKCLEDSGITVVINDFKEKEVKCKATCKEKFKIYQEKETDVAVASKLFEILVKDQCDVVVIMTGDTDLKPAYETAIELFPDKIIEFAFPFDRKNKSLVGFKISLDRYLGNLLLDPYTLKSGVEIPKPETW